MIRLLVAFAALTFFVPAVAQIDHGTMVGTVRHPDQVVEPAPTMTKSTESEPSNPHSGHSTAEVEAEKEIGTVPAPAPPTDHAADTLFDSVEMARARRALRREHGGLSNSLVSFSLAEYQARKGADGYRWEGEGWFGGDVNRFIIKIEGEGSLGGAVEEAEGQFLFGRAISPYFSLEAGVRFDVKPSPSRGYAVLGIEGILPYWIVAKAQLFLSEKGDILARLETSYDQRLTQKLILQPRAELNFAANDIPETDVGSGLSDLEIGLRLRYEIIREFAPYLGVEWTHKNRDTARFTNVANVETDLVNFVAGIKFWF